nr:MAG TPA: hypothetical protein [Caudoviricetes sp.]
MVWNVSSPPIFQAFGREPIDHAHQSINLFARVECVL